MLHKTKQGKGEGVTFHSSIEENPFALSLSKGKTG
jgi:hypothetical protein